MKKVTKILAVLLSVCLLFSLAVLSTGAVAEQVPNDNYKRPAVTANGISTRPKVDGKLDDATWKQAAKFEFTQDSLADGDGLLWSYPEGNSYTELPPDGNGNFYLGWDAEYIYFALQIEDEEHENNRVQGYDLWREDCLQLQIAHGTNAMFDDSSRFELGFAYNATQDRQLGYRWETSETGEFLRAGSAVDMSKSAGADYYYYVGRDDKKYTTTYEIAIKHKWLGGDGLAAKEKFMIGFALHLHEDSLPPACLADPDAYNGYFMEWAQGLVTGKTMSEAGIVTCGGKSSGGSDTGKTTTTTKKTTTTTKKTTTTNKPTTTKPITGATTTKPITGATTTKPITGTTTTAAPTTTATTTTTEAPEVDDKSVYTFDATTAADVADENILAAIAEDFADKELAVQSIALPKDKSKLTGIPSDRLLAVYVNKNGKLTKVEATMEDATDADGNTVEVPVYEVGEKAKVVLAYEAIPTTEATTTVVTEATTTEATKATTTKATEADTDGGNGFLAGILGGGAIAIVGLIIAALVVVAAVVVVILVVLKKKKK